MSGDGVTIWQIDGKQVVRGWKQIGLALDVHPDTARAWDRDGAPFTRDRYGHPMCRLEEIVAWLEQAGRYAPQ